MRAKARRLYGFWRQRGGYAVFAMALLLAAPAREAMAGLPDGVPALPNVAEGMLVSRASGLAIGGYDVVAYHVAGTPTPGVARHEAIWNGFVWRFESDANRQAFLADPDSFIPLFGGLDPVGVARERIVEADPYFFAIHRGKLALFRNDESRSRFLGDRRIVSEALERWPLLSRQISR